MFIVFIVISNAYYEYLLAMFRMSYLFQNHLFWFLVLNSPEKPTSVKINIEDESTKKYMDAETSL